MSETPLVSVCMPAYNVARYVRDAVNSVLAQTLADFELIVIDDGSSDSTLSILNELASADRRIRLSSRPNRGVSATANEAIALARAPLIARMDSDDLAEPDRLQKQVAYLNEHPRCVLLGTQVLAIDSESLPLFVMPDTVYGHEAIVRSLLGGGWALNQTTVCFRKAAFDAVGGYRTDLSLHEDLDLFLRLAEVGQLENLPEVLQQYRRHAGGITFRETGTSRPVLSKILEQAHARRGLAWNAAASTSSSMLESNMLGRCRQWAWMSLKARNVETARKYAWAGLRLAPLAPRSWKLMYCAMRGH